MDNHYEVLRHLEIGIEIENPNTKVIKLTHNEQKNEWYALVATSSSTFKPPLFWGVEKVDFENQSVNLFIRESEIELLMDK